MPDRPAYTWSEYERQFRDARGRFVSRAQVRGALDTHLDAITADIRTATEALVAGSMSIDEWQGVMEGNIKDAHVSAGAIAAGGWQQATAADWAQVGRKVKAQYQYLRTFARDLENGLPLDGSVIARAVMYGISATSTYEAVIRRGDLASGFDLERRILHSSHSCRRCRIHARPGPIGKAGKRWHKAGALPGIGEKCECLSNCRCTFERMRSTPRPRSRVQMGKTSDASEILHRRYFEGKPEMMALFAEEKAKDLADRIRRARIRRVVEFARGGGAATFSETPTSKPEVLARLAVVEANMEALMDRRRAIVDEIKASRRVEFARGGGAKSSKGKAGGKSSKKAKGAATAGKGGACCKGEGGKFAPGNNYGALAGKASSQRSAANRVKERLAAKSKVAKAEKAVAAASGGPKAGIAGMVARSKSASATAGRVQAAREKAALEKRQARNAKVREKRAEKKAAEKQAAAKPARDRAIGAMVAKSKGAAEKAGAMKADRQRAYEAGVRKAGQIKKEQAAKAKPNEPKLTASQKRKLEAQRATEERARNAIKEARSDPRERAFRVLSRVGEVLGNAKDSRGVGRPKNMEKDSRGRMTPEVAKRRADAALKIKRARTVVAKLDRDQQAKLAEQTARVERRRAQQPRLDLTRGDRASAMNRMVAKSKAAVEAKSASPKAPTTASNIASRIAAAKAAEKAQVKAAVATKKTDPEAAERDRAALKAVQAENAAKRAAKPVERDKPGEADARWRTSGIQPHRVGGKVSHAGVAKAAAKIDAKHARTSAMKRMVAKSAEATGKGVAVKSARMAEQQALAAKHGDRLDSMSVADIRKAQVGFLGKQVGTTKPEMIAAMRAKVQADKAQPARAAAMKRMQNKSRATTQAARLEASVRPTPIKAEATIEVGKPATYNGRKEITVSRGDAQLTIKQAEKGGKGYEVVSSYYDTATKGASTAAPGIAKATRVLAGGMDLAKAKAFAREHIAKVGAVEPGGKLLPVKGGASIYATTPRAEVARQAKNYRSMQLATGKAAKATNDRVRQVIRENAAPKPAPKPRSARDLGRDVVSKDPAVRRKAMDAIIENRRQVDATAKDRRLQGEAAKDVRATGKKVEAAKDKLATARGEGKAAEAKGMLAILGREKAAASAKVAALKAQRDALGPKPVTPVKPPPKSVESKPISDPVRLKAEVQTMDKAFDKAPGGGRDNFVTLSDLHKTMPHLSRQEFVAVVNKGRDEGRYGLDSHEGLTGPMTPAMRAASIEEAGSRLVYISRRDR